MNFTIRNEDCYVDCKIVECIACSNEYDCRISAKCDSFIIDNKITFILKEELKKFYNKLKTCYDQVCGEVVSEFEYDNDFKINLEFNRTGQIQVKCDVINFVGCTSKCHLEFVTDQTFINETLKQLKEILY